ncbi:AraC family transcriptional regulator [Chitinophagaceae bacterium LB-8]|uniref:AraC family transcriptional regulator n=1 Tax=Paraflavisolibacter caeni TaxID=2982496 RepID=A0A9X2Y2J4_9BACT|nr:AraC family transcriptional regulator [Paraflavisolibacter caeni]MCU7552648.1 AraC family transcriptional regulator [Paraflavisolibacter caeni]
MISDSHRKKEGFQGQKAIVIPRKILSSKCANNHIISALYVTDIGYYPKAKYHYRERPHGADQHILIYCHEGKGEVTIEKNRFTIEAGEYVVVPMKIAHAYASDENKPWTIYWAHFKGTISDSIVSLIKKQVNGYKGFIQNNEKSIELFNEIYGQLEKGYSSDHLQYSNMCLWHFLSTFIYNQFDVKGKANQMDTIDKAIDFLKNKTDQVLGLEEIAAAVNLSVAHFSYLFKKKTGFTPIEYFNHLKVQKACQYLLFTDLRIKEIALELGIADQYYFSRMFSKVMGMSPNEYREKRIH